MTDRRRARPGTAPPAATPSTSSTRSATATSCSPAATGSTPTSSRSPGPRRRWAGRSSTTTAPGQRALLHGALVSEGEMAEDPPLPRTDRPDAPLYLARYLRAAGPATAPEADTDAPEADSATPLYLRRFRERGADRRRPRRAAAGLERRARSSRRAWAEVTRTKEIVPETAGRRAARWPPRSGSSGTASTQGYSTDARPHPDGRLAGPPARPRAVASASATASRSGSSAPTPTGPARPPSTSTAACSTASTSGGRDAEVTEPRADRRAAATSRSGPPTGLRDVTAPFRKYHADDGEATSGWPSATGRAGWSRSTASTDPAGRGRPDPPVADHPACCTSSRRPAACAGSGRASTG